MNNNKKVNAPYDKKLNAALLLNSSSCVVALIHKSCIGVNMKDPWVLP